MKTYSKQSVFSLILVLLLFCSCNKIDVINSDSEFSKLYSSAIDSVYSISIDNGTSESISKNNILVFPSINHFLKTIEKLSSINSDYNNSLKEGVDKNTFDEPLINFENELNFYSLRMRIKKEEEIWLKNINIDSFNDLDDPDNHIVLDKIHRTLLNSEGEVIIGDSKENFMIYKILADGTFISINNFDLLALSDINKNKKKSSLNSNVKVQLNSSDGCISAVSRSELRNVPGTKIYLKGSISLFRFPLFKNISYATARTKAYYKIKIPFLRKEVLADYKRFVEASLGGRYKKGSCDSNFIKKNTINNIDSSGEVSVNFSAASSSNDKPGILVVKERNSIFNDPMLFGGMGLYKKDEVGFEYRFGMSFFDYYN